MCGIWGIITKHIESLDKLHQLFMATKHRGPDNSSFNIKTFQDWQILTGFHRLAIHDLGVNGDQPFVLRLDKRLVTVMVNGEIYNYDELVIKYNLKDRLISTSDCEIIPLIYITYGVDELLRALDGEFAISIIDNNIETGDFKVILARDPFGVRPLFYSHTDNTLSFSSELKGINNSSAQQFSPGTVSEFDMQTGIRVDKIYYSKEYVPNYNNNDITTILPIIKNTFKQCVKLMINSDRPIGALLSGGLDSSLIVSIVSKYLRKIGKRLQTFSIGIPGSTDKEYAESVSKFCDTDHTHIEFSVDDFLNAVPTTVQVIESYDITTVRASVGQYLVSKWISQNTNIKVLFIGDGSDELTCGYMYFHKAPSSLDAHYDNTRLLQNIHYYDVLRADRGIAANGLEARVPFLAKKFVDMYMSISPDLRIPIYDKNRCYKIEKWLLRKAFDNGRYLPNSVLYRKKEAFSDGVSSKEKSWYEIIQDSVSLMDTSVINLETTYEYLPPVSKESLYYRQIFEKLYPNCGKIIPGFWLPSWVNTVEPSARTLDIY
jgi:asparagine synthase (glutamine-hydrolysing)